MSDEFGTSFSCESNFPLVAQLFGVTSCCPRRRHVIELTTSDNITQNRKRPSPTRYDFRRIRAPQNYRAVYGSEGVPAGSPWVMRVSLIVIF
jgi:hypothetical protein